LPEVVAVEVVKQEMEPVVAEAAVVLVVTVILHQLIQDPQQQV
tara:strand:+ start:106 stop:234 length:129 start_codon:yes stop_codon:yes gene_type:complete